LAHLGPGSDQRLEGFEIGLGLSRKPNLGEDRDAEAERFRIDLGMVAADIARLFQGADAPQAWWRRDSGSLGEVNVSHTAIGLQIAQDAAVDAIELAAAHENFPNPRNFLPIIANCIPAQ